jgi:mannose-1-phosphate guanylyltransferase/phosphomannomutase
LTLIDGTGRVLSDDQAIMAFIALSSEVGETRRVALPVTASDRTVRRCREDGIELLLTPLSPSGLLEAAASGEVSFASDQRGGYVFPAFLPAFDAAAALLRLVSLLEQSSRSLVGIVDATPAMPILESEVETPMEQKGLIMRTLMEQLTDEGADLVLVDGIKVIAEQGWVLVVPDPADPVTHVWAEGSDLASSEALVTTYAERIARMLP